MHQRTCNKKVWGKFQMPRTDMQQAPSKEVKELWCFWQVKVHIDDGVNPKVKLLENDV